MTLIDSIPDELLKRLIPAVYLFWLVSVLTVIIYGTVRAEKSDFHRAIRLGFVMVVGGIAGVLVLSEFLIRHLYGYHHGGTEGVFCSSIGAAVGVFAGFVVFVGFRKQSQRS